jgi:hypothetical protein
LAAEGRHHRLRHGHQLLLLHVDPSHHLELADHEVQAPWPYSGEDGCKITELGNSLTGVRSEPLFCARGVFPWYGYA